MNKRIQSILLNPKDRIKEAMRRIGEGPRSSPPAPSGIGVIVDQRNQLLGVVTDGDIRRAILQGLDISKDPVSKIMSRNPFRVHKSMPERDTLVEMYRAIKKRNFSENKYHHIVVIGEDNTVEDVVTPFELWRRSEVKAKNVAIIGLGYVGLTLGLSFNELGIRVVGVDANSEIIKKLSKGEPHFYERGLDTLLKKHIHKNFFVKKELSQNESDVYVICVGTAVDNKNKMVLSYLKDAARSIGRVLKAHDLVLLRSTVAIGTCRDIVIPILEKESGLKTGTDFFLAFAPERTVEGKALEELRTLPQIIGGYNKQSLDYAVQLFQPLTSIIVTVSGLEAAEAVKLLNNTFRDLTFSFANEVSQICSRFNLSAIEIIRAANEGYPRDKIPYPSPGVGGSCLVKDPYILAGSASKVGYRAQLPKISRSINKSMINFVYDKVNNFCVMNKKDPSSAKVFMIGIAFKGDPETSDIRDSTSVDIIKRFQQTYKNIFIYDPVAKIGELKKLGAKVVSSPRAGFRDADCVLVLNNNRSYRDLNIYALAKSMAKPSILFDGWGIYTKEEISTLPFVRYEGV